MSTTDLLIGGGRLATSLGPYLRHHGRSVVHWSRRMEAAGACPPLSELWGEAGNLLLAIRDDAIEPFIDVHRDDVAHLRCVHFSGALVTPKAVGLHPLYAFPKSCVPESVMATIPFVGDAGVSGFAEIFPDLPNPHYEIPPEDKPLYHALAVLTGNLASFLWNRSAITVEDRFGIPPADLFGPYFKALIDNFEATPLDSLTGPVKRRDLETVNRNLDALRDQPRLKHLYEAFLAVAWEPPSE